MMNYIWAGLMVASVLCGMATGRIDDVSDAIFSGGTEGVDLCLTLLSMMLLWGGLTAVMQQSGLSDRLGRLLSPVVGLLFPELKREINARNAIAMNMAANVLGLGNAATPLGLAAMEELQRINGHSPVASNSMVTFVVLNSVSVQLIPTGLAALRTKFGAENPMDIIGPVWFASALAAAIGVGLALLLGKEKNSHG